MLLAWGDDRVCTYQPFDKAAFELAAGLHFDGLKPYWQLEYKIPYAQVEKYFGKIDAVPGFSFMGNFYKCGDETSSPHYGSLGEQNPNAPCAFHDYNLFSRFEFAAKKTIISLDVRQMDSADT